MKTKVLSWKPDIIQLWNFPSKIDSFIINQAKNTFSFSGTSFKLPILLRVTDKHIEPLPEGEYSAPLRFQLADFKADEKFIWVDRCFKMGRIWQPSLALSGDWCVAMGQPAGQPTVTRVDTPQWKGQARFPADTLSNARYQLAVAQLRIEDNAIRYDAESFLFAIPGAPASVKQFSGISRQESWGRWSNASLAPDVTIEFVDPLPAHFDLVITARAYGPNIHRPIPVRVGDTEQLLTLGEIPSTHTLRFDNPEGSHRLTLSPPEPQLSNLNNIAGQDPRKLGIGLVELKVVPLP